MSETKQKYAEKRLIHVTREQEEKMATQRIQGIQQFVGEAAQIQARRCEMTMALLTAHATRNGIGGTSAADAEACRQLAHLVVDSDSRQKWTDLKALFVELGVRGPQPHLEWSAKQCGVVLFDEPVQSIVQEATPAELLSVVQ